MRFVKPLLNGLVFPRTFNQGVGGSNPPGLTTLFLNRNLVVLALEKPSGLTLGLPVISFEFVKTACFRSHLI